MYIRFVNNNDSVKDFRQIQNLFAPQAVARRIVRRANEKQLCVCLNRLFDRRLISSRKSAVRFDAFDRNVVDLGRNFIHSVSRRAN